jgi:aryl-alcohol dehydrogenase-like predicted oxidoreductase
MEYTTYGSTALEVSRVAFGTWQFGGDWGDFPETTAVDVIHSALDAGYTFFDSAQAYGYGISETVLGKGLGGIVAHHRDEVVISTKGGLRPGDPSSRGRDASAAWMRTCLEQSLRLLGVDYVDVYHVHWPDPKVDMAETAGFMADAISEGLIRYAGVSNFTTDQIEEFGRVCPVSSIQPPYHMLRRDIEETLLPYARANGIGVMTYSPLASGLLGGRLTADTRFDESDWRHESSAFQGEGFLRNLDVIERLRSIARTRQISVAQLAIAWALSTPGVDAVVMGARSATNAQASGEASDTRLTSDERAQIDEILRDSQPVGGISPEGID